MPAKPDSDLGEFYCRGVRSELLGTDLVPASIRISWVPREMNAEADQLVKDALAALD